MTIEYLGEHQLGSLGYIVSVTLVEALQQAEASVPRVGGGSVLEHSVASGIKYPH